MGVPGDETWELERSAPRPPEDGEVQVEVLYLSIDPAMRGWLNDVRSYIRPVAIGEVMRAMGIGRVVASRAPGLEEGALVVGTMGWQQLATMKAEHLTPVSEALAPPTTWLGVLGLTGLTAWFGLLDIGRPEPGQTVLVSGAAGAVGSVVGQIARIKGCRAVGIAGGADKRAALLKDFGYDAAIDYKAGNLNEQIRGTCSEGIDVFFDNVGGPILDAALRRINRGARIVICGAISGYNAATPPPGPANYMSLLINRARMEGFVVFDYVDRYPEAIAEMAGWLADGRLTHREHIVEGLESAPEALRMLFAGANQGKMLVKVKV